MSGAWEHRGGRLPSDPLGDPTEMQSSPRLGAAAALLADENEAEEESSGRNEKKSSPRSSRRAPSSRALRSRRRAIARRRHAMVQGVARLTELDLGSAKPLRERYDGCDKNELLGLGGMGEVRLLADRRIGRQVAIKLLRDGGAARFLREARVQGQLEHPSIVPVYDVGIDDEGQVYFTMKRVRGTTLREVMKGLHAERYLGASGGPRETSDPFTPHKLLSAFAQVCLAVDFAHSRGVVHRDLKPSNIMLGSFGEVYVLDWGVAKLLPEDDDGDGLGSCESGEGPISDVSAPDRTAVGDCVGTPGYMAPEQIEGKPQDAQTDIYALGAILFEILALCPLHRGTLEQRLHSSLAHVDVHGRVKSEGLAIDVPADLAHVIQRCVALDPRDRYPSARALHEAIETYLEGNRDAEQRRMRAAALAETATESVDQAISANDPTNEHRRVAMRAISKALSLDPANEEAMRAFVRLITDSPCTIPKEVEEELSNEYQEGRRTASRTIPLAGLCFMAFLPLAIHSGVRSWPLLIAVNVAWVLAICVQLLWGRAKKERAGLLSLPVWCIALGLVSSVFGPYILTPALACFVAICFVLHSAGEKSKARRRIFVTGMSCASILVPVLLEKLGVVSPAYQFIDGKMIVLPRVHGLTAFPLLLGSLSLVLIPALLLGRVRDTVRQSRLRTLLTTWHLKQFLPAAGRELPNRD